MGFIMIIAVLNFAGCINSTDKECNIVSIFDAVPYTTHEAVIFDNPNYEFIVNGITIPNETIIDEAGIYDVLIHQIGTPYWSSKMIYIKTVNHHE